MAVRIRVYPQNGMGGMGGMGLGGAYGINNRLAQVQLQNQRKTSALQLQYERALWQEKIKTVQLQTAMQYGAASPYGAQAVSPYGVQGAMFGGLGLGGLGGFGGSFGGFGGSSFGGSPFGALGLGSIFG